MPAYFATIGGSLTFDTSAGGGKSVQLCSSNSGSGYESCESERRSFRDTDRPHVGHVLGLTRNVMLSGVHNGTSK